jgi:hypothetical protein
VQPLKSQKYSADSPVSLKQTSTASNSLITKVELAVPPSRLPPKHAKVSTLRHLRALHAPSSRDTRFLFSCALSILHRISTITSRIRSHFATRASTQRLLGRRFQMGRVTNSCGSRLVSRITLHSGRRSGRRFAVAPRGCRGVYSSRHTDDSARIPIRIPD